MVKSIPPPRSTGASSPTAPTSVSFQPSGLRLPDSPNAIPLFLGKRLLLSFNPLAGYRSGLHWAALRLRPIRGCVFRHCSASLALPAFQLLCPLLTSPRYSAPVTRRPASLFRSTGEISRGKTRYLHCIDAGFTKCTLLPQMEDFAVTCPLVPNASRLISGFCSSPRSFGLGFLQTLPHGNALALLLAFGSANLAIGLSPTK
jgi:hypothetical protein